jgi:hypothetical protein
MLFRKVVFEYNINLFADVSPTYTKDNKLALCKDKEDLRVLFYNNSFTTNSLVATPQ